MDAKTSVSRFLVEDLNLKIMATPASHDECQHIMYTYIHDVVPNNALGWTSQDRSLDVSPEALLQLHSLQFRFNKF